MLKYIPIIVIIILIAFLMYIVFLYNEFTKQKVATEAAWAGINVQLKRRCDLIPNLVETAKGYAKFEASTFEAVTKARSEAMAVSSLSPVERGEKEASLQTAVRGLLAITEKYPELKASEQFLNLQQELTNAEDRIAAGRRFYNANVRMYEMKVLTFPYSLVARYSGFKKSDFAFFQAEASDSEPVKVDFTK